MSRIAQALLSRKALISYVTVGYPSIEATLKVVPLLADNGCDIIELGSGRLFQIGLVEIEINDG